MTAVLIVIWLVLGIGSIIAFSVVGVKLARSAKRVSRSLDPINQNLKTLKIEISTLNRQRADRQRRLNSDNNANS